MMRTHHKFMHTHAVRILCQLSWLAVKDVIVSRSFKSSLSVHTYSQVALVLDDIIGKHLPIVSGTVCYNGHT